ncbi:uncharacterized protein LOC112588985 [Harpegnathos saltator]|uniref:uncharacterized protein LOC112588985 n=1 Tax=Harpegnathos saltator TaxID=610380 RepID=UPI000DBEF1B1|nr:uncharacterized protein LOC112588985 [Harpegnathos saltator]
MSSQQPNTSTSASSVRSTYSSEIHSIIRFLTLRNESAASIHRQLVETYGSEVMNRQNVTKWIRSFKEGRTDTHDEERNGRPSVISENLVQQVEEKVRDDRRVTLNTLKENFPHVSRSLLGLHTMGNPHVYPRPLGRAGVMSDFYRLKSLQDAHHSDHGGGSQGNYGCNFYNIK